MNLIRMIVSINWKTVILIAVNKVKTLNTLVIKCHSTKMTLVTTHVMIPRINIRVANLKEILIIIGTIATKETKTSKNKL